MKNNISKESLRDYIKQNEVVFQAFGDLIEIANESEEKNKQELLSYFDKVASVEVYSKGHWYIKEDFCELNDWSSDDDVLFLLQNIGVLICVPKNLAVQNKLIVA